MPDEEPMFHADLVVTATAQATHPEGAELDENGHPITTEENCS